MDFLLLKENNMGKLGFPLKAGNVPACKALLGARGSWRMLIKQGCLPNFSAPTTDMGLQPGWINQDPMWELC